MKTTYVKSLGVDSLLTRIQLSLETRRHWAKSMLNVFNLHNLYG